MNKVMLEFLSSFQSTVLKLGVRLETHTSRERCRIQPATFKIGNYGSLVDDFDTVKRFLTCVFQETAN